MGDLENAAQRISLAADKLTSSLGPLVTIENDIDNVHLGGLSMILSNLGEAKAQIQEAGGSLAGETLAQIANIEDNNIITLQQEVQKVRADTEAAKNRIAQVAVDLSELANRVRSSAG